MNKQDAYDTVMSMSEPATPRSEQRRNAWGSMLMSIQTVPGLCGKPRAGKGPCWRKAHEGKCD